MDDHPDEWRLKAQVKSEYCPALLTHDHGAGQCRLKPGHDGEHTRLPTPTESTI